MEQAQEDQENIQPETDKKTKPTKVPFWHDKKKRLTFIILFGLLLIILCAIGLYFLVYRPVPKTAEEIIKTPATSDSTTKSQLFESLLTGVYTDQASANRHPLGVMVENHPDARPQSGLSTADIVYEAIAEGGITRYLAIFGTKDAVKVGPIRSARTYFVDWAHSYNAYLAHVGGNMDALDKIQAEKTYNLDQFIYPNPYWREYAAGLATEHTMYSSTAKLYAQAATNGYPTANNFNSWKFKDDPDQTSLPASQKVSVHFSSSAFDVSFVYDKPSNSYKRFLAGKADVDKATQNQINPKNVIVMTVQRQPTITRINEHGYNMTTVGTGKAKIFIDGKEIDGTWSKSSTANREIFKDSNNQEITFNRGSFWICVIPPEGTVTAQ